MTAPLPFRKMHGLGNDFVVLDARERPLALDAAGVRRIADRRLGVGCDQLITVEASPRADAFMRIHNADGGEVAACGNATRCVAALLMQERGATRVTIETRAGLLQASAAEAGQVTVDMDAPSVGWSDIPLRDPCDTLHVPFTRGPLVDGCAVNVGNPHIVFFVPDAAAIDLSALGPAIEHDPFFPERVNVNVAQILAPDRIRLRVWERGAGITLACGTGACATLTAAARRNLAGRRATIVLDGGPLVIEWTAANRLLMTGPVAQSFDGHLAPELLNGGSR